MQSSREDVGETAYYSIQNSTEDFLKNMVLQIDTVYPCNNKHKQNMKHNHPS
jgi:hypothetical protein